MLNPEPDEAFSGFSIHFDDDTNRLTLDFNGVFSWLEEVVSIENGQLGSCSYVITSDEKLLDINRTYLDHDTYTDIITFPFAYDPIETEIYVSVDRVVENAQMLGITPDRELLRVMVHGLLHMLGYDDKTESDRAEMRLKENVYLELAPDHVS